jgi:hypothetical protein
LASLSALPARVPEENQRPGCLQHRVILLDAWAEK